MKTEESKVLIIGGSAVFYRDAPPSLHTSKYFQQHRSGGARPQALGLPVGQIQGRPTRHWLQPVSRRAAIEGSLSLTVERNFDPERSRRGGKGMGYQERAGKGVGGGSWYLLDKGGVQMKDPQSWDNSNRYKVANLTKQGYIIVSLWPLCRVWNTTALLCARLRETDTGQEEDIHLQPHFRF